MFESICIGRPGGEINESMLGCLAESLLFYDRVSIVVNHSGFASLARICGPDTLRGLVADGPLNVIYQENRLAVASQTINGHEQHAFVAMHVQKFTAQEFVVKTIQDLMGRAGAGRRLGMRINELISKRRFEQAKALAWIEQINENGDINTFARQLLAVLAPAYPLSDKDYFRLQKAGGGYVVDSSIDFAAANRACQAVERHAPEIKPAWILSHLYEGHANLTAAAEIASDIGADPLDSSLARTEVEACLERAKTGAAQIQMFQEVLLDACSVSDAIVSGQRNFEDLRQLIDESRKFRDWVRGREPDSDLLKEYAKACTTVSWTESLPKKTLRFSLFNAAAIALGLKLDPLTGAAASVGLNAVDTFLFERLVSGWKPNQFVAGPLSLFVKKQV